LTCMMCHPADVVPVGEDTFPPFYADHALDPCLDNLDNDGDLLYDVDDPDCAANEPPVADPNGPYTGTVGQPIQFDGSGSVDPDGTIVSYDWDFGDGNAGSGVSPTHTYAAGGIYTVTVTVTDDGGATDSATTTAEITDSGPCGNGILEWNLGETCDPPGSQCGRHPKWQCNDECQCINTDIGFCGDGIVQPPRENCEVDEDCEPNEICDDCHCRPDLGFCGDGKIQWNQGETCDPPGSQCGRHPNWQCNDNCECVNIKDIPPGECEPQTCGTFTPDCNPVTQPCFCFEVDGGGGACINDFSCTRPTCRTSADCPAGEVCVTDSCCGGGTCAPERCTGELESLEVQGATGAGP
jgi:PKD repeat protein